MFNWLKRLFGLHTCDTIVRPLSKITEDLEALVGIHATKIKDNQEAITRLSVHNNELHDETAKANRISASIKTILEG